MSSIPVPVEIDGWRYQRTAKTVSGTNATVSLSPGTGYKWLLLYGSFKTVTSAVAGTRDYALVIDDGTNVQLPLAEFTVVASKTVWVSIGLQQLEALIGANATLAVGGTVAGPDVVTGIPPLTYLEGADRLRLVVNAGADAGDAITLNATVFESVVA